MQEQKPLSLPLLLTNWLSVSILFLANEAVSYYGALAGLMMVLALGAAFLTVLPFLKYQLRRNEPAKKVTNIPNKIIHLETIVLSLIVGGLLIENMLGLPITMNVWPIAGVALILAFLSKRSTRFVNILKLTNIALIFFISIFFPIYIYLQDGLETVYHNLLHYHPEVLHLERDGLMTFFLLCFLIFFVKLYSQLWTIRSYTRVNSFGKAARKVFAAVVITSSIILSMSTMTIVAITHPIDAQYANNLLVLFMDQQASHSVFLLFVNLLLTITTINLATSFQEIATGRTIKLEVFLMGLLSLLLVVPLLYNAGITVLMLFLAFGGLLTIFQLSTYVTGLTKRPNHDANIT